MSGPAPTARRGVFRRHVLRLTVGLLVAAGLTSPASAQSGSWPSERPPRPLAAPEVDFPSYRVQSLENGLQIVVVEQHEQPAVTVRLLVKAGAAQDPTGKAGVANLLATLLDQGTTGRSAQELATTIDTIGGALSTGAGSDLIYLNGIVMTDSFRLLMDLMSEIMRRPAFSQAEIDRQRQQVLSGFQVSYTDPDYVAGVVFDRLVYGFSPYGLPNPGTPESVARISRADLVAYHETYFAPNNCVMAIVGDVGAEEAFAVAERAFGDWERREVPPTKLPEPPPPTRRVIIVDKPDAVQTEIRAGHVGIPRKHQDYMAMNLAIKVLGGEGSNRLHRVLRSERGLTYGASADLATLKYSGDIEAETDTRSDATAQVLRLMVDEFWTLQRERVSPRELSDAQAYLTGNFPLTIETPNAIALQVLNALFYELDLEELETYRERVNAVSVDDIQRVARAYLRPDRLSIVLVGNASAFIDELKGMGFDSYELVPLDRLDLTSANFMAPDQPARPVAGASRRAPGVRLVNASLAVPGGGQSDAGDLVARAIRGKGGLETLQAVRTVEAKAQTTLSTPQGPMKAVTTTYIEYPDRFRVEAELPIGRIVQIYSGGTAWIVDPSGTHEAPPEMREEFGQSVRRDILRLLLGAHSGDLKARRLEPVKDEAGKLLDVLEISGDGLAPVRLFIDPGTNLIVKQTYQTPGPTGADETTEELFSDYRAVDGLQVAFQATVRRGGHTVLERAVQDFRYNADLDRTLFQKP